MHASRVAGALALAVLLPVAASAAPRPPEGPAAARVLILHDETGAFGWLGELYAVAAGHLASHFGTWEAAPVRAYRAGQARRYDAVIYVGSTYDEPIPDAFLDDVLAGTTPVVWVHANVWALARRQRRFEERYGFDPWRYERGTVTEVLYKGERLSRAGQNDGGIMTFGEVDRARVHVLAEAIAPDGARIPWALSARNLLYVGDNPFVFLGETDRYLAFADLLFDVLAPRTPARHRALVRLEDVTPLTPPAQLRAAVDVLAAEGVPFSVAVIPVFVDPARSLLRPSGRRVALADAPALVAALKDAVGRGGTLVLHGYTHQYGTRPNPVSGVTAADFEFWVAKGTGERPILVGPVPESSPSWAADRIARALREFDRAGLPRPRLFEFPHYLGSGDAARGIAPLVRSSYQRGTYFSGALAGVDRDPARRFSQIFPYEGRDVYGFALVPENCGPYRPWAYGDEPVHGVDEIVRCARANLVVRDGWASFFYHPPFGPEPLRRLVAGVRALGYTFVPPPVP